MYKAIIITVLLVLNFIMPIAAKQDNWKGNWNFNGRQVAYQISIKKNVNNAPVVFYLTNLRIKRIGLLADKDIISNLVEQGYAVVNLDCSSFPSGSPQLEEELMAFHYKSSDYLISTVANKGLLDLLEVYYIPAGYTIARNLTYWNELDNGAEGTAEHIVKMYNKYVVKKFKVPTVETINEIKGKNGENIDYNLHLDVIYPSGKLAKGVPLMVNFSTQPKRMSTFSLPKLVPERMIYPLGFLLDGYAWANVDHNFVPIFRDEYYGFVKGDYSLDKWNGLASSTAAIRFLRKNAGTYNLGDKIGAMGISKGSYAVTRLADTKHTGLAEYTVFENTKNGAAKQQPNAKFSSKIDVGYTAAGDGTDRVQYFTKTSVPLVSSAGKTDKFKKWDAFPKLLSRYEAMDINYLGLWMEDRGHTYPTGKDFATGQDRYFLVKRFFDSHLQPQKELQVLYILPSNGNRQVMPNGNSLSISQTVESPPNMQGISIYSPITVRFATSLPVGIVFAKNVKVVNTQTLQEVEGNWKASLQNTRFEFSPKHALQPQTEYSITVLPGIKDTNGASMQKEVITRFKTQ